MKEKILAKILEIEKDLPMDENGIGLHSGEAGRAIFYAYLSYYLGTNDYDDKIEKSFIKIFEEVNNGNFNPTFCSGLSGVIWGIEHLKEKKLIDLEDGFENIYGALKDSALYYSNQGYFDFLHGADGIVYNLLLLNEVDEKFINTWLELLYKHAVKTENGFIWETIININSDAKGLNLSLSHGLSSKIIILAQTVKKFPENKLAKQLLEGSVNCLLQCKNQSDAGCCFPSFMDFDNKAQHSRLAWCYGDLGNAISLWRAGSILQKEEWKTQAIEIMLAASKRKNLKLEGVVDTGFCHGTAGIAHVFNRFYIESGIKEFDEARMYWIQKTLDMADFTDGIAGFKIFHGMDKIYKNESSFLEGAIGIGLVLLGFLKDEKQNIAWDGSFLMN